MCPTQLPLVTGRSSRCCQSKGVRRREQTGRGEGQAKACPVRTCLGCGVKVNKTELVRFVVFDGCLAVDGKQVVPGRGAYCCRKIQCYHRFVKQRKKLAWALRYHDREELGGIALSQGLDAEFASYLV